MCSNKKHLDFSEQTRNNYIQKLKTGSLKNNVFDVFVAGGGITGASVARDCAYKELSIVLAEKSDWASGASSESTKIIHRGVLYLDRAFAFIRKALRSSFKFLTLKSFNRRTLGEIILYWTSARDNLKTCRKLLIESKVIAKMSTQITMQKKVYMVIEKEDKRSIFIMYAGLMLHWIVGGFSLECPKIYFRKKTIQNKFSELNTIIIKGVLTFAEYVTDDTLLTIYTIKDAFYHGAVCIPFLLVKKVEYYSDRNYYAVTVSDTSKNFEHSTNTFKIKARKFINAAGVHVDAIHHRIYDDGVNKKNLYSNLIKPVKGGHVIVRADKIGSTRTYLMSIARTKDGISKIVNEQMNIFVVYRNELGTTGDNYGYYYIDTNDWVEADNRSIEAEIERRQYLFTIKELNKKFSNDIGTDGVMCHGVKPLPHSNTFDTLSISREHKIINYCGRYFIVLGVKLALARIAAKEVVEMLCQDFGCKSINLMRTMTLVSLNMPKNPYILSAEKMKKEQMLIENACMEKRYGPGGILFLPAYEKELYQKLNEF